MVRTITAAAALAFAGSALAAPLGAFWVERDNSAGAVADGTGFSTAGTRTFDLFVELEPGDVLFAADFGIAGPNAGLSTTQTIAQHLTGGDTAPAGPPAPFELNKEWDTHVALGDATFGSVSLPVGAIDWDPTGFSGAWSVAVPNPGQANPDNGNAAWIARITLSSAGAFGDNTAPLGEFLGGEFFVSGESADGTDFGGSVASTGVVSVGNAFVPTPGAMALFGLAGVAATRRRR